MNIYVSIEGCDDATMVAMRNLSQIEADAIDAFCTEMTRCAGRINCKPRAFFFTEENKPDNWDEDYKYQEERILK